MTASQTSLTASALRTAVEAAPNEAEATHLAEQLTTQLGRDALLAGAAPLIDEMTVAWAITAPDVQHPPVVVSEIGIEFRQLMVRLGTSDVYAAVVKLPEGSAMRWRYEVDGTPRGGGQLEVYRTHPDSREQPGIPKGALVQQPQWRSGIFAGTVRDWWLYVPAQYEATEPACAMVFQDGAGYKDHVPAVFDNLIACGDMPVTIGVFLQPGRYGETTVSNRQLEYDTLSDRYSRFLLEEILPEVEQVYRLRHDAAGRAIAGISSGGICAFTVAWQRPDQFSKVLSWVGSFTNMGPFTFELDLRDAADPTATRQYLQNFLDGPSPREGGHVYSLRIRKTPKKPIRVFLQGGEHDLDVAYGNWPLANQEMAKSLAFAGYDYQFVYGLGFHSPLHGRAILPDALRWLWRDHRS